jgi:hypothetical protein
MLSFLAAHCRELVICRDARYHELLNPSGTRGLSEQREDTILAGCNQI